MPTTNDKDQAALALFKAGRQLGKIHTTMAMLELAKLYAGPSAEAQRRHRNGGNRGWTPKHPRNAKKRK